MVEVRFHALAKGDFRGEVRKRRRRVVTGLLLKTRIVNGPPINARWRRGRETRQRETVLLKRG